MKSKTRFLSAIALAGLLATGLAPRRAAGETIPALAKPDASIAFLGDSITQQGAGPLGYVTLVLKGLEANGIQVKGIKAGISGHKSNNMLARLERDVLRHKPTIMTLSCGVNDVWHGKNGVPSRPTGRSSRTWAISGRRCCRPPSSTCRCCRRRSRAADAENLLPVSDLFTLRWH